MDDIETLKVNRSWRTPPPDHPAGLLKFHPLEEGARMRFFALQEARLELGRSAACGVVLDDSEASRRHAALERRPADEGGWAIVDLESANGVFVNGVRAARHPLEGGEVIRVGATLFRFLARGTAPASRHHAVSSAGFVGGPSVEGVLDLLTRAAKSDLSLLITGETGTGKELAARQAHEASARAQGPFVAVNCSAIPLEIAESELFGHVRGAFTGAVADKRGLVLAASGGTLFLDEIGEMPPPVQVKLLRVLQDRRVRAVGGAEEVAADVRLVAATNLDLAQRVSEGAFRADLHARITELELHLPPLRARIEDVPLLAAHFAAKHAPGAAAIPVEALELLCCQRWPYNARQLESAVRRAIVIAEGAGQLRPEHFLGPGSAGDDGPPPLEDPEAAALDRALTAHAGDVRRAAAALGISRSQLYRRAKRLGIHPQRYRGS
jgi:transcriptional regulator with PAS, ATPase and Fis domain